MAGKTHRPAPASATRDTGGPGSTPTTGRSNALAQTLLGQQQVSEGEGLGFGDSLAALRGELHLSRLLPAGVEAEFAQGDNEANELDYDKAWLGGNDSVSIDRVRINRLAAGGMSAENLHADNIQLNEQSASRGRDAARLTVPSASAQKITGEGISVASAEVEGITAAREYAETDAGWTAGFFAAPGTTEAAVRSVKLTGVSTDQGSAQSVTGAGLSAQLTPGESTDPQLRVGASNLSAAGVSAGGATVGQVSASDVSATAHATSPESVAFAGRSGAIHATDASFAGEGLSGSAEALSVAGISTDGSSVEATGLTAEEIQLRYQQATGGGSTGADASVLTELLSLVQSAHVQGAVPLNAGQHGRGKSAVKVPRGAQAVVELTVAGNRIVPRHTSVDFTPDLGTMLWPKLDGVYITNTGRVFLDVRKSLFIKDQDLLELMGMGSGRAMPLGLPAAAELFMSGGTGSSAHSNLANVGGSRFTGTATLAGQATVGGMTADVTSASVGAAVEGGDRIGARITDMVLKSIGLQAGGANIEVGNVQSDQIDAQHAPSGGNLKSDKVTADRVKVGG